MAPNHTKPELVAIVRTASGRAVPVRLRDVAPDRSPIARLEAVVRDLLDRLLGRA